jgi:hypothetical protein
MSGTNVTLPDSDLVEVKLCADRGGVVSLGIRINGSNWYVLASGVTLPQPGSCCQPWSKAIGGIMNAPPSRFP